MSKPLTQAALDQLLTEAREAPPSTRIELRDQIASHGENAIEAMTDWLGDERLAAFAIRVLERIGREPANRDAVQAVLAAVDRDELPPHLAGDIDQALKSVGSKAAPRDRRPSLRRRDRARGGRSRRLASTLGSAMERGPDRPRAASP